MYIKHNTHHSLGITISSSCIVQWSPIELVQASQQGSVGHQGEDTLVLGSSSSIVEGGAAILVTSIDVGKPDHVQYYVHTLNVPVINRV